MKKALVYLFVAVSFLAQAADINWPDVTADCKPGTRWWWLGSAVDTAGLKWNLDELSDAGIGTVEITPIYGVQGNDANEINYLSPEWMSMYKYTQQEAGRLGMYVDMNCGTGWPFGGPTISTKYSATKKIVQKYSVAPVYKRRKPVEQSFMIIVNDERQKDVAKLSALMFYGDDSTREIIPLTKYKDGVLKFTPVKKGVVYALFSGRTFQKVKRAAPGAKGLVMNHLSKEAVDHYFNKFDTAFSNNKAVWPHCIFNDSYEVYRADWTDDFFKDFKKLKGYDFTEYLPEFNGEGDSTVRMRVVCDYREVIGDLLLEDFTKNWTGWAHSKNSITRNQAHGSPGNLLDLYGVVDIPECETFGMTDFEIPGYRIDKQHKESDSSPLTMKFASSAAHVTGKKYASSESMTWLTEHFRTSLSQIKPEMDMLFLSGINRVFYHGSPYSPKDAPWPGWLFYASILVNPNNTIFRDMGYLNSYITRVQSFLQEGKPDNDVLLYFPIYDVWQKYKRSNYMAFDIHKIGDKLPSMEKAIYTIRDLGYDLDYISDKQLYTTDVEGDKIVTKGGDYKMIVVPECKYMPVKTARKLAELAKNGAVVVFFNSLPDDVPGLKNENLRRDTLKNIIGGFGIKNPATEYIGRDFGKGFVAYSDNMSELLEYTRNAPAKEEVKAVYGADFIRRRLSDGYVYFIAMQKNKDIDNWVKLGVDGKSAMIFNPLTGEKGRVETKKSGGKMSVYLQLKSGQSVIVRTYDNDNSDEAYYPVYDISGGDIDSGISFFGIKRKNADTITLSGDWKFKFKDGVPEIRGEFEMEDNPVSWTELPLDGAKIFAGTGRYSLKFKMPKNNADDWALDLDGLAESARVYINGEFAGAVWALPYTLNVGKYLKPGKKNTIDIDVTNLPANRIADYDRRGVKWRIFKEINFVNVFYKKKDYSDWDIMPSGLTRQIKLKALYNKDLIK